MVNKSLTPLEFSREIIFWRLVDSGVSRESAQSLTENKPIEKTEESK